MFKLLKRHKQGDKPSWATEPTQDVTGSVEQLRARNRACAPYGWDLGTTALRTLVEGLKGMP